MALKQIALAYRELFIGAYNFIGLEFDNVVARANACLHGIGTWTTIAYSTGTFLGSGAMTWTVPPASVTTMACATSGFPSGPGGQTCVLSLFLVNTTVGGTPNNALNVVLPNAFSLQFSNTGAYSYRDNGTYGTGVWEALSGGTTVSFYKGDKTNWAVSSGATDIRALCALAVN